MPLERKKCSKQKENKSTQIKEKTKQNGKTEPK